MSGVAPEDPSDAGHSARSKASTRAKTKAKRGKATQLSSSFTCWKNCPDTRAQTKCHDNRNVLFLSIMHQHVYLKCFLHFNFIPRIDVLTLGVEMTETV